MRRESSHRWHNLRVVLRHRTRTPNVRIRTSTAVVVPVVLAVSDPGSSRLVYAMVAGLIVTGLAFVGLGIWLVRQTRYDPPVLAPLERMGDRDWRKRDAMTQRRILDEVRPDGASPISPQSDPPRLDAEFELEERPVSPISDLGPGLAAPAPGSFPAPMPSPIVEGSPDVVDR